ncbi:TPA: anthranilate/aminodeoxychorismate synthase component II [bacterium]|nr:anthranilate/aminodeoxychorismate synthase component II [bacterium]
MILIIDNYDSFTYNLVQYIGEILEGKEELLVFRNDKITLDEIKSLSPCAIVISPGPGKPKDAGISEDVIKEFGKDIPILGVCLGHQAIGEIFGGKIVSAERLMHGKTSEIFHDGRDIFKNIENPFIATRYHSLVIEPESIPSCLEVSAKTKEGEIMGIRHKEYPIFGVQFHPESILTIFGKEILRNFIKDFSNL